MFCGFAGLFWLVESWLAEEQPAASRPSRARPATPRRDRRRDDLGRVSLERRFGVLIIEPLNGLADGCRHGRVGWRWVGLGRVETEQVGTGGPGWARQPRPVTDTSTFSWSGAIDAANASAARSSGNVEVTRSSAATAPPASRSIARRTSSCTYI